ncbi:Hypothetical protein LDBND_1716 [Lactobacillus delbrueckii subsp. bulgaricus ND02]|nr:Hypothetical protein LDBND_1716 [Lactobacillus delbrueckii subsp. bulgaricus ND02]EGD27578.1 hypothetical protein HMPREF5505_0765 [Lactobacillus delbrueckii subsp. lactis DSM 20072]EPB98058.1 hypothetical protein G134_408 [Lactobacillus delbrueckii subsp. lactis CRL581]
MILKSFPKQRFYAVLLCFALLFQNKKGKKDLHSWLNTIY